MTLEQRGHDHPQQRVRVVEFPNDLSTIFPKPTGLPNETWPSVQVIYLGSYLADIGCKTLVVEDHYVDRDYIGDVALFYSRSLRAYPNYCYRLHFFSEPFDEPRFRSILVEGGEAPRADHLRFLQASYLGFSIIRPLVGAPIGRTVLKTYPDRTEVGERRVFGGIRDYTVHLGGYPLRVRGLAFQQQDQGVSACATTALWSALHRVAPLEGLRVPTPADITQTASRYVLQDGRALPSGGLSVHQICEAIRAAELSPLLIQAVSPDHDRAQILAYTASGFPPVLAIQHLPLNGNDGHAVCAVGVKLGEPNPPTDPNYPFRDAATAVRGVYLHDDRLGPYATTQFEPWTLPTGEIATLLRIRWPGSGGPVDFDSAVLRAIIVPLPLKIRLTVARLRGLASALAQATAKALPQFANKVTMDCRYICGTTYRDRAFEYGLSEEGLYTLLCGIALSRYVGLIQLTMPDGPVLDVLVDATETEANPSVLACVKRPMWPDSAVAILRGFAKTLGGMCIV